MSIGKGSRDYLALGDWNAQCYECGRKRKATELRRHWQGYYVCPEHWEPRQPQDFVRGTRDTQTPPWTQPWPGDLFVQFDAPQFLVTQGGDFLVTQPGDFIITNPSPQNG